MNLSGAAYHTSFCSFWVCVDRYGTELKVLDWNETCHMSYLGGGFKYFLFSHLPGEMLA